MPHAHLHFSPRYSPRWLAEKGRMDEALATLARLHAHGNVEDTFVRSQMEDIKAEIHKARDIGSARFVCSASLAVNRV